MCTVILETVVAVVGLGHVVQDKCFMFSFPIHLVKPIHRKQLDNKITLLISNFVCACVCMTHVHTQKQHAYRESQRVYRNTTYIHICVYMHTLHMCICNCIHTLHVYTRIRTHTYIHSILLDIYE